MSLLNKFLLPIVLVAAFTSVGAVNIRSRMAFTIPSREVVTNTVVKTNSFLLKGDFWTEWIVETNTTPTRACMEKFDLLPVVGAFYGQGAYLTNIPWDGYLITNGANFGTNIFYNSTNYLVWPSPPCDKEHFDSSEKTETLYVQSNLVAFLVWRGRTNVNYLESIPVTNIVRKWHFEKKRVQTQ
jgi:hypothetical protein